MTDVHVILAPGLSGELSLPDHPHGLVVLVGDGEDHRELARLRAISGYLRRRDFATLRLVPPAPEAPATRDGASPAAASHADEQAPDEAIVAPLAHRLLLALGGLRGQPALASLPVGLHGIGVGAAAAVVVAAERPDAVRALVSQSGRVDLALPSLSSLKAPLLLIVGGYDAHMFELARDAARTPGVTARVEVVTRATQLFEEAGALERVALAAGDWFEAHLRREATPPAAG